MGTLKGKPAASITVNIYPAANGIGTDLEIFGDVALEFQGDEEVVRAFTVFSKAMSAVGGSGTHPENRQGFAIKADGTVEVEPGGMGDEGKG